METSKYKNTAAMIHLSTMLQYIFPFGNFIFPVIIWSSIREKSEYVDVQGRRAINFQLSVLLYTMLLILIAAPILLITIFSNVSFSQIGNGNFEFDDFNFARITWAVGIAIMALVILGALKVAEFFLVIYATVACSHGEDFKYPLTIPFLRPARTLDNFKKEGETREAEGIVE